MMRPCALLGSQFLGTQRSSVPRRWKSFIRRVDSNNDVYYEPTKTGGEEVRDAEPKLVTELFEMPDLVLDLDAEDNPNVRPSDDADEQRMHLRSRENPRRTAVQARLKDFKEELFASRRRSANASARTSMWRLSQHDILSAALFGAPRSAEGQETRPGYVRQSSEFMGRLGVENGIPQHAALRDLLFLEWMMLRQGALAPDQALSSDEVAQALRGQATIRGIRRILLQNLPGRDISDVRVSSDLDDKLAREIRHFCLRVCDESLDSAACAETLSLLGNLSERLSRPNPTIYGLALSISAKAKSPAASSVWIHRGFANNVWKQGDLAQDIVASLDTYARHLGSPAERQFLFQVLTGLDEHGSLAPDSFRALAMLYADDAVYEAYVRLLGRLGALRTLWHEGRGVRRGTPSEDDVFREALTSGLRVAAVPEAGPANPSLEECVTLDYHSIGAQDPNRYDTVEVFEGPLPSLGQPFDEWLAEVRVLVQMRATYR